MGKYQQKFAKSPRDYYATLDSRAVKYLAPHLEDHTAYCEPCAGGGHLIDHLSEYGHWCVYACDIEPQRDDIDKRDAHDIYPAMAEAWDCFITNPPFSRAPLKNLIDHLSSTLPTWLLLPADLMHNQYMAPYMKTCPKVVSIGRLWWNENKIVGKENYCWYLFYKQYEGETVFVGKPDGN